MQRGASQRGCNCRVNGAVKGYSLRHRAEGTLTLPCDVIDDRECALKRALARVSKRGQNQTLVGHLNSKKNACLLGSANTMLEKRMLGCPFFRVGAHVTLQ